MRRTKETGAVGEVSSCCFSTHCKHSILASWLTSLEKNLWMRLLACHGITMTMRKVSLWWHLANIPWILQDACINTCLDASAHSLKIQPFLPHTVYGNENLTNVFMIIAAKEGPNLFYNFSAAISSEIFGGMQLQNITLLLPPCPLQEWRYCPAELFSPLVILFLLHP